MKQNNITLYAKVLAEILSQKEFDEKKIVNNFIKLLVNTGYQHKSKEILDLTQNLLLQKQGKRKITFETARSITTGQRKIMEGMVKKGDMITEKINPELIAGIKITFDNEKQFDNSLQGKLSRLS